MNWVSRPVVRLFVSVVVGMTFVIGSVLAGHVTSAVPACAKEATPTYLFPLHKVDQLAAQAGTVGGIYLTAPAAVVTAADLRGPSRSAVSPTSNLALGEFAPARQTGILLINIAQCLRPRPAVLTAREVYHSNSYGSSLGGQRTVRLMGTLRRFRHICQDVEDWFDVPSALRTRASLSGAALALVGTARSTMSFGDEGSTSSARTGTCGREGKRRALWILGSRVPRE